jgi:hypothetical protein
MSTVPFLSWSMPPLSNFQEPEVRISVFVGSLSSLPHAMSRKEIVRVNTKYFIKAQICRTKV